VTAVGKALEISQVDEKYDEILCSFEGRKDLRNY
jgi:hypothetical protein